MSKKIQMKLSDDSIKETVKELRRYKAWIQRKEEELRLRLAMLGATVASIRFRRAIYNGSNDVTVRVDDTGNTATIYAEGESVAFIEFGSGKKYGYGHPQAGELGFGPGTWSDGPEGKGHWDNEHGWWFGSGQHSYGNPPAMAMVDAVNEVTENVTRIAKEVFKH
jgi:hypothetical protein